MDEQPNKEALGLKYGFKWFEYHAGQRMETFHYYLVIYSGLAAAVSFLLKEKIHAGSLLISSLMILMSILFWQLDVRNRQLIKIGENIISTNWLASEMDGNLNPIHLSDLKQSKGLRFRQMFGAVFALGGTVGLAMLIYAICLAQR
jgi:hypothetical protein